MQRHRDRGTRARVRVARGLVQHDALAVEVDLEREALEHVVADEPGRAPPLRRAECVLQLDHTRTQVLQLHAGAAGRGPAQRAELREAERVVTAHALGDVLTLFDQSERLGVAAVEAGVERAGIEDELGRRRAIHRELHPHVPALVAERQLDAVPCLRPRHATARRRRRRERIRLARSAHPEAVHVGAEIALRELGHAGREQGGSLASRRRLPAADLLVPVVLVAIVGDPREQAVLLVEPQQLLRAHGRAHLHRLQRASGEERRGADPYVARGVSRPLLALEPHLRLHRIEVLALDRPDVAAGQVGPPGAHAVEALA